MGSEYSSALVVVTNFRNRVKKYIIKFISGKLRPLRTTHQQEQSTTCLNIWYPVREEMAHARRPLEAVKKFGYIIETLMITTTKTNIKRTRPSPIK
jgi:hypothetical protein